MTVEMITVFVVLLIAAILFVDGRIRSDIVALCALMAMILLKILTPEEALSGFSNSIVIMMAALFIVGGGIFQTGLAKMISNRMLKLAGNSEIKLLLLVMIITAFIGAFVSNTGTVALMMPVVVSMAMGANMNPGRLLMPLAFASSMGGMLTLIGTPPNLIINDVLINAGYAGLSFFSFSPIGIICIVVGVICLFPLTKWFLAKRSDSDNQKGRSKSLKELANEYQLAKNLYRIRVKPDSSLIGKTLVQLSLTQKYSINILEIRRNTSQAKMFKSVKQESAGTIDANTRIQTEDVLYVMGNAEKIQSFVAENQLELLSAKFTETSNEGLLFSEIGIAEVVLMPNSRMIGREVKKSEFRENYNVNILGIQRRGEYILHNVKDMKMQNGDALLVQGSWENIARLKNEQNDWVVVGEPLEEAAKIPKTKKAPIAGGIMLLMIISMTFNLLPPVVSIVIAALLMIFTGCLRSVEDAYKTINWQSLVLIAAMLPMSIALENTGASTLISDGLVSSFGKFGPLALLAGVYLATMTLTMFISNTATAVLLAPIALSAAVNMGVSPYPFLLAVSVAASMCFASPFSTPPNALVMSAGQYTFMDYVKVGGPLQIIIAIVMILLLPLIFPF